MTPAATNGRKLRTFLVVSELEAKEIGARIKQARLEAGMTQEQVGEVATFSKRSLQDYESGNTIPYKHLREIANLFRREVPWFLHGESEEQVSELASISVRLLSLEAQVREALRLTNETLQLLREAVQRNDEAHQARARSKKAG